MIASDAVLATWREYSPITLFYKKKHIFLINGLVSPFIVNGYMFLSWKNVDIYTQTGKQCSI